MVCTLPLGVLQQGGVAFDPPLPGKLAAKLFRVHLANRPAILCYAYNGTALKQALGSTCRFLCVLPYSAACRHLGSTMHAEYKQTAIHGLAMGTENRVAMLFDKARTCTAACAHAELHDTCMTHCVCRLFAQQRSLSCRVAMLFDKVRFCTVLLLPLATLHPCSNLW